MKLNLFQRRIIGTTKNVDKHPAQAAKKTQSNLPKNNAAVSEKEKRSITSEDQSL